MQGYLRGCGVWLSWDGRLGYCICVFAKLLQGKGVAREERGAGHEPGPREGPLSPAITCNIERKEMDGLSFKPGL